MKQFDRADAERLVQTYSDLILRLAYTYLKSTHDAEDSLRAAHRRNVGLEAAAATPAPAAPDSDVLDAVMALPRKYREAVYLHYYEGYSVREIASLLGQSESAVSAHLSRGRKSLRTTLGGDLYEQRV